MSHRRLSQSNLRNDRWCCVPAPRSLHSGAGLTFWRDRPPSRCVAVGTTPPEAPPYTRGTANEGLAGSGVKRTLVRNGASTVGRAANLLWRENGEAPGLARALCDGLPGEDWTAKRNPNPAPRSDRRGASSTQGGAAVARRAHNPEVAGSIPAPATRTSAAACSAESTADGSNAGIKPGVPVGETTYSHPNYGSRPRPGAPRCGSSTSRASGAGESAERDVRPLVPGRRDGGERPAFASGCYAPNHGNHAGYDPRRTSRSRGATDDPQGREGVRLPTRAQRLDRGLATADRDDHCRPGGRAAQPWDLRAHREGRREPGRGGPRRGHPEPAPSVHAALSLAERGSALVLALLTALAIAASWGVMPWGCV